MYIEIDIKLPEKIEITKDEYKPIFIILILIIIIFWVAPRLINFIDCKFFSTSICSYKSYKMLINSLCEKDFNYHTLECQNARIKQEKILSNGFFGDE